MSLPHPLPDADCLRSRCPKGDMELWQRVYISMIINPSENFPLRPKFAFSFHTSNSPPPTLAVPNVAGKMLTLTPGCACDVCAEEYGTHRLPHSIPCGHVLCASCCQTIVEKTSPRLAPVCPFCREQFTADSPRLIRMDFTTSGWSTPRRIPAMETFNDFNSDLLQRKTAQLLNSHHSSPTGIEVRRLEAKVAKAATKKCSVEEVSSLYKELEEWIAERDDHTSSLVLSAALLRAILSNHVAHSEASKAAKTAEANLKLKIEDLELANTRLEADLRRQRSQYTQKSQEGQQLRSEVSQLRALATTLGGAPPPEMPAVPSLAPTPSPSLAHIHSQSTSPTPYSSSQSHYMPSSSASAAAAAAATPLSRFNTMHSRSASMSSRPTTPAVSYSHSQQPTSPTRSQTPAPPRSHTPMPRSHTPGPGHSSASASAAAAAHAAATSPRSHTPGPTPPRSHTPGPTPPRSHTPAMRAYTPAPPPVPPVPVMPMRYSATPAPQASAPMYRGTTPGPMVPPKPRRLSLSSTERLSPPRLVNRSTSEEKKEAHQRWLPSTIVDDYEYPTGGSAAHERAKVGHVRSASRAAIW